MSDCKGIFQKGQELAQQYNELMRSLDTTPGDGQVVLKEITDPAINTAMLSHAAEQMQRIRQGLKEGQETTMGSCSDRFGFAISFFGAAGFSSAVSQLEFALAHVRDKNAGVDAFPGFPLVGCSSEKPRYLVADYDGVEGNDGNDLLQDFDVNEEAPDDGKDGDAVNNSDDDSTADAHVDADQIVDEDGVTLDAEQAADDDAVISSDDDARADEVQLSDEDAAIFEADHHADDDAFIGSDADVVINPDEGAAADADQAVDDDEAIIQDDDVVINPDGTIIMDNDPVVDEDCIALDDDQMACGDGLVTVDDGGLHADDDIDVTDNDAIDSDIVDDDSILVDEDVCQNINAPVLEPIGDKVVTAGNLLSFALYAFDLDACGPVAYQGSYLPFGAALDAVSGQFSWTPLRSQVGNYIVQLCATDGVFSDCEDIDIRVDRNCDPQVISQTPDGAEGWGGAKPTINYDGTKIVYMGPTSAVTKDPSDTTTSNLLYDAMKQQTSIVSAPQDGSSPNGNSWKPSISADGNVIAFRSDATNLVAGVLSGGIFVYDASLDSMEYVLDDNADPLVSPDGNFIAFNSIRSDLVPNDINDARDVFLYDRNTKNINLVSLDDNGKQSLPGYAGPSLGGLGFDVLNGVSVFFNFITKDSPYEDPENFIYRYRDGTSERVSMNHSPNPHIIHPSDHNVASVWFIHYGTQCLAGSYGQYGDGVCINGTLISYDHNGNKIQYTHGSRSMSSDAKYAIYGSLQPPEPYLYSLYVRDIGNKQTKVVETQVGNGTFSFDATISGNGKWVTYVRANGDVMLQSLECYFVQ